MPLSRQYAAMEPPNSGALSESGIRGCGFHSEKTVTTSAAAYDAVTAAGVASMPPKFIVRAAPVN